MNRYLLLTHMLRWLLHVHLRELVRHLGDWISRSVCLWSGITRCNTGWGLCVSSGSRINSARGEISWLLRLRITRGKHASWLRHAWIRILRLLGSTIVCLSLTSRVLTTATRSRTNPLSLRKATLDIEVVGRRFPLSVASLLLLKRDAMLSQLAQMTWD